jgi:D-3-phosphoglycerate dehydrogenase
VTVYVLDPISPRALAALEAGGPTVRWDDPAVGGWVEAADGLVTRTTGVPGDKIRAARRLKVIGKHGVGVDNVDLAAAREKGIRVTNTPGANADAVAELTLCLALACARHVGAADRALRAGKPASPALFNGRELAGRAVGVVGYGQVGRRVGALFHRALGSPIHAYDPGLSADAIRAAGAEPAVSLDALVAAVDVVTVHVPLTPQTRHAFDTRRLGLVRPGAILINAARGGVVDEAALAAALRSGPLAAAASDVFEVEPPPADHPLLALDNFIATPHIGAQSEEAMDRVGLMVAADVLAILEGRAPAHPVV